jgi:nucleotide-binding universal stress UspA family protein
MHVVVAIDGSKYSQWALNWAARLPLFKRTAVTAVHVVDIAALRAPFVVQPAGLTNVRFLQQEGARLVARGRELQKESATRLAALSIRGRSVLTRGPIAASILRHARKGGLIVVGHRGLDAMDRVMLGSTSARIVRQAPCSVLVVKEPARPIRRVVLATDGSAASRKALHFLTTAVDPAARPQLEVVVCHVMPYLRYPEVKEGGRALVRHVADKLVRAGYQVVEAAKVGRAADEIVTLANRDRADLVLVGARGHGAVARFFLGSVSTRVLDHARASVLIAR